MVLSFLDDPIKVTPTSKAVGDFAQFLVGTEFDEDQIKQNASTLDLPQSVIDFLSVS